MRVHCRLREIMHERRMKVEQLHRRTGVGRETIAALRKDEWTRVSREAIGRICGALNITLDELFVLILEDIWAPIKLSHEVTIHYGSRPFAEPQRTPGDARARGFSRQYAGVWDMRSFIHIFEYLKQMCPDISVRFQEHRTGVDRGFDPSVRESVRRVFASGNHVVIGSQIANQFTEEVVCFAYGVPPYAPGKRDAFPYGFVWDSERSITSSFGWQGIGEEFGIVSTRTGRPVALRTVVEQGEGQDCALILVYRMLQAPARRRHGADDERIVIAILGDSGLGTLAAAQVATDERFAAGLYPPERGKPHMRAVALNYIRAATASTYDNREVTEARLVEDAEHSESPPPAAPHGVGHRQRPGKARKAKNESPPSPPHDKQAANGSPPTLSARRRQ